MRKNSKSIIISKTKKELLQEIEQLRTRLTETEETIEAIRRGEVDAIVVSGSGGEKVFTLTSAEKPYRIIIEEMEEGAVTLSETGTILYCNRKFAELVSIPMDQIIGSNFTRFINEKDSIKYRRLLRSGLSGRIKGETVYMCRKGTPVYLHLSFCPMPQGMLGRVCIIVTDITELKNYQQDLEVLVNDRTSELQNANQQLEQTNATKDKLFSIIAHDLKGPFTTLLGFSDLLMDNMQEYDIDYFRTILSHINSAAKSAFTLLENLLIWARSQSNQLQFSPHDINLVGLVGDIAENLNSLAIMKNISVNILSSGEVIGYVDENMFRAIMRNLISNAIKFTNAGGKIEIALLSDNQGVEIAVSDNGMGMTEETKNRLFLVNSNMTFEGTAHEKGTGLGLLLCNEFVEKHGGEIFVESKLDVGSTFRVTFPSKEKYHRKEENIKKVMSNE